MILIIFGTSAWDALPLTTSEEKNVGATQPAHPVGAKKKPASIATFGEEGRIENTHYLDT